ncbi:Aerobic respiration control sensor protein ArcB, partial [Durusdinium trenchii]
GDLEGQLAGEQVEQHKGEEVEGAPGKGGRWACRCVPCKLRGVKGCGTRGKLQPEEVTKGDEFANKAPQKVMVSWLTVMLALLVMFAGVILSVIVYRSQVMGNENSRQAIVQTLAVEAAKEVDHTLDQHLSAGQTLADGLLGQEKLSRMQFHALARSVFDRVPGVRFYTWAIRVERDEREEFESKLRQHWQEFEASRNRTLAPNATFPIKRFVPPRSAVPQDELDFYYPIEYRYPPFEGPDELFSGLDSISLSWADTQLQSTMEVRPLMTPLQSLPLAEGRRPGILMYHPTRVVEEGGSIRSVFVLADLLEASVLNIGNAQGLDVFMYDVTDQSTTFLSGAWLRDDGVEMIEVGTAAEDREAVIDRGLMWSSASFEKAGRIWEVVAVATENLHPVDNSTAVTLAVVIMALFVVVALAIVWYSHASHERMLRDLRVRQAAQKQVVNYLCHELRNPIHAVRYLCAEVAESRDAEEKAHLLHLLQANSMSLSLLIDSFLDFSKLDTAEICMNKQPTDILEIVTTSHDMFALLYSQKRDVRWAIDTPDDLVGTSLLLDPTRVRQIVTNGLSNAAKYTSKGLITTKVVVLTSDPRPEDLIGSMSCEASRWIDFVVQDSGVGLGNTPPENLFVDFVQTAAGKATASSSGLGLPIARKLARLMGGDVFLKSREDGVCGTEFHLCLPLVPVFVPLQPEGPQQLDEELPRAQQPVPEASQQQEAQEHDDLGNQPDVASVSLRIPSEETTTHDDQTNELEIRGDDQASVDLAFSRARVISCDDDPVMKFVLERMLRGALAAEVFLDPEELLARLDALRQDTPALLPDVVLLDITIGNVHGSDVMRTIRSRGFQMPLIAVTGNSGEEDCKSYLRDGFAKVVTKPYTSKGLKSAIVSVI